MTGPNTNLGSIKISRDTTMSDKPIDINQIPVKQTPAIKLKDKAGRGGIMLTFAKDFGFTPETIIIQKVHGQNNTIIVSAVYPDEVLKARKMDDFEAHDIIKKSREELKKKESKNVKT